MKPTSRTKKFIIALFWILLWQLAAMAVSSPLLLPGPLDTIRGLVQLVQDPGYYHDIAATVVRCIAAILLALAFGFVLALASYRVRIVRDILSLPVAFFKSVPIMAVAIYMIFLLASGNVPVLVCFIMCFPIVYTNLLTGLDSMDAKYLEMAHVYRIPQGRVIRHIYWPQMYPYFKAALSLIAGMSWKAIVTAEVLSIPKFSLGYELMNAKYYLNTDILFAYVATIVVISLAFERLIRYLLNRFDFKAYAGSKFAAAEAVEGSDTDTRRDIVPPGVTFTDIHKAFGEKVVFDGFTEYFAAGETTAVMAPSGIGKTTLLRILVGLETADQGTVTVAPAGAEPPAASHDVRTGVLFQEDRLLPWLNVYDNLAVTAAVQDKAKILALLEAVGLAGECDKLPGQLSGGMNHRVALARMFLCDADLYIADEPFRGLDEDTRAAVIDRLWKPGVAGRTAIVITHDPEIANSLATRVVSL
ncbi:MAG: ATP-binding cassette domain-containing protein [Mogibacterium sp.]|nr:ATP-binding cassette domain-containing protein [Mogibacterium sp.]